METINDIAKKTLNLETLETRKSDSLDFSDQSVWNIKTALEQAQELGRRESKAEMQKAFDAMVSQYNKNQNGAGDNLNFTDIRDLQQTIEKIK